MMRKWMLILTLIAAFGLLALPAAAQGGTILDIAAGNPDFSTLVAAVQAADPAIAEALGGAGPLTVFAPTNQAFANLLSTLGLTAEELLANTEILNQVLLYHVVAGSVLAADVVALDGQTVPTLLEDSAIAVSVVDGTVVLNEVVEVVTTDIVASNGVVHVINDVLLPGAVIRALNLGAEQTEPAPTEPAFVNVQVAHLSPDTPAVDVYVNGEVAVAGLEFNSITNWLTLPAGSYEVAVAPAGTSIEEAAIGPADFELPAGAYVTVAAVGSLANGTLAPAVLVNDFSPIADGSARVTVFHAIEDAPAVDVIADGSARIVQGLGYPGSLGGNDGAFTLDVPAGTYDLAVVPSGATSPVVIDLSSTTLDAGSYYLVAATGTLAEPGVALFVTNATEAAGLNDALVSGPMMPEGDMDMAELPTIAEIVVASTEQTPAEFTILLAAVQAADPAILEALSSPGELTVFAPTDAAFLALFEALGLTAEEVLADTDLLNTVLQYHVVPGVFFAEDVIGLDGQTAPTLLEGETIAISIVDGGVVLNGLNNVILTDIAASNGVIHVIDGVLLPSSISG